MSAQLSFSESDIYDLPFAIGDTVLYKDKKTVITNIYIRPYEDTLINDIIVCFENGDYTFHDDYQLKTID